jgi:hypothetical protein
MSRFQKRISRKVEFQEGDFKQFIDIATEIRCGSAEKQRNFIRSLLRFLDSDNDERSYEIAYSIRYRYELIKLIKMIQFGQKIDITIDERYFEHFQRGSNIRCGAGCTGDTANNEVCWIDGRPQYTEKHKDTRNSYERDNEDGEFVCNICGGTGWTRAFYCQTITVSKIGQPIYNHMLFVSSFLPRDVFNIIIDFMNKL